MPESDALTMPMHLVPEPTPALFTQLREDLHCVFERDPAARSTWEVLTTYPGVHAIIAHRIAHRLWGSGWRYAARLLSFLSRMESNIDIHPGACIGHRFFIDHGAGVVIGETAEIGDDVTLYHGVTLGGTTLTRGKRHPTLGNNVVVGAGAKILGAIRIADGARVGANSVVVKDVPAGCTVVGIPGRIVNPGAVVQRGGINLDHHLVPDPIGRAISCLLDRVDSLEAEVRTLRGLPPEQADADAECGVCIAGELCCEEHHQAARS